MEIDETLDYFPRFFSLDEIYQVEEKLKPFQDIILRYKEMVSYIEQSSINT